MTLMVRSGSLAALRLFDIAYAIDLTAAERNWRARDRGATRSRIVRTPAKAVAFEVPPLVLDLGAVTLELGGEAVSAAASVRLYDFGIAAFALRVGVTDLDWAAYSALANALDAGVDAPAVWTAMREDLVAALGDALDRPSAAPIEEDHLLASVDAFDRAVTADELLAAVDLVPLLTGETRPLSKAARADLLRQCFSWGVDDLAVITWDRAFLYQAAGDDDVANVVELANAQLLEMRGYDEMLDAELPRLRALTDDARRHTSVFAARRYARLARRLHALVAEVTELTERVDNALQVTEDVYLARVYGAAIELFRVPRVGAAVDRKLAIIRETYSALQSEADGRRAELLELTVIALIATEIVLSLVRH